MTPDLMAIVHGLILLAVAGIVKVLWSMRTELTRTTTRVEERLGKIHDVVNSRLDKALETITELKAELRRRDR